MSDLEMSRRLEAESAERYARETADHVTTVLHDDGLYRHVRVKHPDHGFYRFELITWPGSLTVRGDYGDAFTFTRDQDMFEFFRRSDGINPHYWSQKIDSGRDGARAYSEEAFKQQVWAEVREYAKDHKGLAKAVQEEIFDEGAESHEDSAREALRHFRFGEVYRGWCTCGKRMPQTTDTEKVAVEWSREHEASEGKHLAFAQTYPAFQFSDVDEWDFQKYHWQFLWACHAIVDGIAKYDTAKAEQAETAVRAMRPGVRNLVQILNSNSGAPCWIVPSPGRWALLLPRGDGSLYFLQGFQRKTVDEAVSLGLVRLGDSREPMLALDPVPGWLLRTVPQPAEGRTIAVVGGAS